MAHRSAVVTLLWILLVLVGGLTVGSHPLNAAVPLITGQPLNRNVLAGSDHTFQVSANGTPALRYQWRFNGSAISDATNTSLSLTSIQTNAAGLYSVIITNSEGAVTSSVARLTVRTTNDPVYPAPHSGWSYLYGGSGIDGSLSAALDGTWNHELDSWSGDSRGAGNGPIGGLSSSNGIVTIEDGVTSAAGGTFNNRRFYFTRNLAQDSAVTNAGSLLDDGVTLTFRARLTPPSDPLVEITNAPNGLINNSDGKGMFGIRQSGSSGLLLGFSLAQAVEDVSTAATHTFGQAGLHMNHLNGDSRTNNVDPGEPGTPNLLPLDPSLFHEFWITIQDNGADSGTHRVSVYVDGALTPAVFNVTAGTGVDGPATNYLALGMGSTAQRGAVDVDFFGYRAGVVLPAAFNQPAGISAAPVSQFVAQGQLATFQVGVTGTPPYSFQWYRNGALIAGATNASYTAGPVAAGDDGASFVVAVANEFNTVTSSPPAQIRLASAPVITTQPASQIVTNGDAAQFTVVASSAGNASYQWRREGASLANETNASLTISIATPASVGNYDVIVSNNSGSVTSQVATLTVVTFDYGDALNAGFQTARSNNGARHRVVAGVYLGATIDVDLDGQSSPLADGDDLGGTDDEDGVGFQTEWIVGQAASIQVTASVPGVLSAWVDWNHDGNWSGAGEQIFTNRPVSAGANALSVQIPPSALAGGGHARFRFSTAGNLSSFGPAADGEVEDYFISVTPRANLAVATSASGNPVAVGIDFSQNVVLTNQGPSIATSVALTNLLPAGVSFVGVSSSQGSCFQVADQILCDLGAIPNSSSVLVTLTLRPTVAGNVLLASQVASAVTDLVLADNSASALITALQPPAFTLQPQNRTVTNGSSTVLTASASGSAPLVYQWFFNGAAQPGQTNASLSIPSAGPANQGSYFVRVTNLVGVVDSATVTLSVLTPPSILTPPSSATNLAGSAAIFSVVAAGSEPLFYQWRFNGTNVLTDEVTATLAIPDVRVTNAGAYSVTVSNAAGVVASAVATLTVIEMDFGDAPGSYPTTLAQNGARHRLVAGIRLGNSADFEPAALPDSLATGDDLGGVDDEDGVLFNSPLRTGQNVGVTVNASVSGVLNAWVDFNRNGSWADPGEQVMVNRSLLSGNNALGFMVPVSANVGPTFARFRFSTATGLSFVGEAANGEVEDYAVNIEPVADLSILRMTQINPVAVGSNQVYTLVVSNAGPVVATGVALTDVLPAGLTFVSATSTLGGCTHSAGNVVCAIGSLNVSGFATITINALVGIEGSIQNSATVGANQIDVVPGNNSLTLTASALVPPGILAHPADQFVANGGAATFSVSAVGTNLRYQWLRNGTNLAGATSPTLAFPSAVPGNEGTYSVRITNEVGVVVSSPATLTVLQPVTIIGQPQSQTVLAGSNVTLTVTVTGTAPLSYQWEFNGADIIGATSSNLVLSGIQTNQAGQYRVRVENSLGMVSSVPATLTIYLAPAFTVEPVGQTNPTGGAVTFAASLIGTEPLRLQWYFNRTTVLTGQTNATLTLTSLLTNRSGDYTLVATNIAGSTTSAVARLAVFDMDFGDAPPALGYPTTMALNGARHRVVPGVRLGAQIDFETNGIGSVTATGDDSSALDDEDGVVVPAGLLVGQTANFSVNASVAGFLDAWIDFNGNGTWNDPGEHVASSRALEAGVNAVPITIASGSVPGTRMARFRFSTAGGLSFDGFAPDGEVEDHQVTFQQAIDMQLGIIDSTDPVSVSSNLSYTISVTNRGPATAGLVWVTNALPPSFTFVSASPAGGQGFCNNVGSIVYCLLDDMAADATASINLTVRANATGTYTNRAWVLSLSGLTDANFQDNTNIQATVVVGTPLRYRNPGTITVSDAAPGVPGKGSPYPSVINVSGITSALYKVTVTVSNLTHDFAKDFDLLLVGPRGQHVLLMSDAGASTLSGVNLVFDDFAPDPLPSSGFIPSGTYRPSNYGLTPDVFPAPAPSGPFGSTLGVFSNTDPNGPWSLYVVDGIVGGLGSVLGGWGLELSTADPIADLAVTAAASTPSVALGSNLTYSVTLTNRGPAIASAVRLTNALPAGVSFVSVNSTLGNCANQSGNVVCDFGTLGAGAGAAVSLTVMPNASGLLTNNVQASSAQLDLNGTNNLVQVVTLARPLTDLAVAQVPSTNLVLLGQNFTYTLHVTNRGPNAATNIRLTDVLPATASFVSAVPSQGSCSNAAGVVECDLVSLSSGSRASVLITVTPTLVSVMTNSVSATSDEIDSLATNNSATNVLVANVAADLATSVSGGSTTALVNSVVTYNVTVTNRGPGSASGATLTNPLPAGFTFVAASSSVGSCELKSGAVICSIVVLDVESSAQIVIQVRPTIAGLSTMQFAVGGSSVDFVSGNNVASSSIEVRQAPFIITQPQGRTVTNGASVILSTVAGGHPAPTYQWSRNGVDILNASGSIFTIPVASVASVGDYRVRAVNSEGSVTSFVARVNVIVPPTISDVVHQQINEDTASAVIPFVIGDSDTPVGSLSVTASSSDQTVVAVSGISLGGSLSNRTVRILPATNRFGVATITLRVSDPNGMFAVDTFQVTVNPINDPPTLNVLTNLSILEDSGQRSVPLSGISSGAPNETSVLTVTAESSGAPVLTNLSVVYSSPAATGELRFTPVLNVFGTASVTVRVNDGGLSNNVTLRTFSVTVTPENDLPNISVIGDIAIDADSVSTPIGFTVEDVETAADQLTVTSQSSNLELFPPGSIQIQGSGTNRSAVLTPAPARSGTAMITITAADLDGGSSSRAFLVSVRQTGEPPEILVPPASQTVTNGARVTFAITAAGSLPIVYQWNHKGLNLPGATNASLVLPSAGAAEAGEYSVVVRNGSGSVTSAPIVLRVLVPTTISGLARTIDGPAVTFGSLVDLVYLVEFTDSLAPTAWRSLKAVTGTGGLVTVTDTNAPPAGRFYRVRVLVAPAVTSIRPVSGSIEIAFSTFSNVSYTVETSDGLETALWRPLTTVSGTGGIVVVPDNSPEVGRRLYRVRVE